jgi:hypothetical protein
MEAYKYYKDLPAWAKGVALVGAGVIVYFVGYRIYKYAFPSNAEKRNKELANNIQSEIIKAKEQGLTPSYADSNYNTMANTIYNSMRYAVGDNYGLVVDTMKNMKNNLDVAKLIKAFGMKQDYVFGLPEGSPKDLFTFVQSELGNEYGVANFRIKSINSDWAKKGITYKL